MTLQILPELVVDNRKSLSRCQLYEKYCRKLIEKEAELIRKKMKAEDFFDLAENSGILLAEMLHRASSSRITFHGSKEAFLKIHDYNNNLSCLENPLLCSVIRGLDLNLETRGWPPNERIQLGFGHDIMKNYYLVKLIRKHLFMQDGGNEREVEHILGVRSIVEDELLVRFIAEEISEGDIKMKEALKKQILKSQKNGNIKEKLECEKGKIIAAANAITILVAADVDFVEQDFKEIQICGANLRDGNFVGCDFTEADLTGVNLENCNLESTIFNETILKDIQLGTYLNIMVGKPVKSCVFSNDGMQVLTGDGGGFVKLWDKTTGKFLKSFEGHQDSVNSVTFSIDGKLIISGSSDYTIKIWDKMTGKLIKSLNNNGAVKSVTCSPDGQSIISTYENTKIKIWDKSSGLFISLDDWDFYGLGVYGGFKNSVAISPDGQWIVSASSDRNIQIWDKTTGKLTKILKGHTDEVRSVAISPDGQSIISGSWDGTIKIWDMSGKLLKNLNQPNASVAFSPDGQLILSGSLDGTIKIWDKSTGKLLKSLKGHQDKVISVSFSPDGKSLLSGSIDGTIKIWDNQLKEDCSKV